MKQNNVLKHGVADPAGAAVNAPRITPAEAADTMGLVETYDTIMFRSQFIDYFEGSHFTNYGYWAEGAQDQRAACETLMEKLLALAPSRNAPVLDVACGMGGTTTHLSRHYGPGELFAVNISSRQLRAAREVAPQTRFCQCDAAVLPYADASFGTVMCVEAAFHFRFRASFLKEAWRILKPGGALVLSDILMTRDAEERRKFRHAENYLPDLESYQALLKEIGFEEVRVLDYTTPCWHGCYWFAVRHIHQEYLDGKATLDELKSFLQLTYRRVHDTEYYLAAACHKGVGQA